MQANQINTCACYDTSMHVRHITSSMQTTFPLNKYLPWSEDSNTLKCDHSFLNAPTNIRHGSDFVTKNLYQRILYKQSQKMCCSLKQIMILPEQEDNFHHQQIEYWYLVCENLSPLENLSVIIKS